MYRKWGKRFSDIMLSVLLLVLLSPVLVVIAVLVQVNLGSPVLYFQDRAGRHGRAFRLIKFRSMLPHSAGSKCSDADRLTAFGRRLRKSSLDEIPELINILKGDMSLIGPRPLLTEYLPLYNQEQARRHEIRPGLTGLAQVNGRNSSTWTERLAWDIKYLESYSFRLDVRIVMKTFSQVFRAKDVSHPEEETMPKFMGTNRSFESGEAT